MLNAMQIYGSNLINCNNQDSYLEEEGTPCQLDLTHNSPRIVVVRALSSLKVVILHQSYLQLGSPKLTQKLDICLGTRMIHDTMYATMPAD